MLWLETIPATGGAIGGNGHSGEGMVSSFLRRVSLFASERPMAWPGVHVDGLCERCGHWHTMEPNPPANVCVSISKGRLP